MRSTAFEVSSGMRVAGADSFFSTLTDLPTAFSTSGLTSCSTRSMENPTHSLFLLTKANGGEPVRVPIVSVPLDLIFSSVSWASAGVAVSATASVSRTESVRIIRRLLVCEDLGQELPSAVGFRGREEFLGRALLHHLPLVHEDDPMGDPAGEAHLVGDAHHRHALAGQR